MEEFKILGDLVRIDTIKDNNNYEFIQYISSYLKVKGFSIELVTDENNKLCLIAKSMEDCNLCFLGHSDTVSYNGAWLTDPFTLQKKENNLYGLGVCDMKGGISAFLNAVNNIDLNSLKKGIMIAITFDEEIGFKGINMIKDRTDIPKNIIIGEPTDLIPIAFCKGCMEFNVCLKGKSVHSSNMIYGENAILKTCDFIKELQSFSEKLKIDNNSKFDIPYTTMNIAMVNGGTSINIVPNQCNLSFDFRTILESHHKLIIEEIKNLCNKYNCSYSIITDVLPSNNNDKKNIKNIEKILNKKTSGMNYVTEGNFLNDKNVFIIGPGPITAHEVNEHISVESYRETIKAYTEIIYNYCNQKNYTKSI